MGFQLGPKPLRRPPKGWLPARAFPLRHSAYEHPDVGPDRGETVLDSSAGLTVTWRVEPEGREPYELAEQRAAPSWLLHGLLGGGKRWYKVRARPSYGLMPALGVPCFVDPRAPGSPWVDWDAAYDEHVPAWEREARVQRAVAERDSAWDGAWERVFNPFAGRLRDGEEAHVQEALARRAAREAEQRALGEERAAALGFGPVPESEAAEHRRRGEELARVHASGRKTTATVVAREETDRSLANVPVIVLTFDVHDGDGGAARRVVWEHVYGPRHAKRYTPGRRVEMWVDPADPGAICPGR